ncbi:MULTISPECIES: hypothetical protein [Streptomyces]|uniref:Uncharacterized protein n=1 Tax=Streptomyces cacaoi TaxID=1898 RepID=A0A4Y3QRA1_STRCI|nr:MULTISPECIES: hypothetical protein [Streptomyces]NNG89719.1 hypothetical protein [Streptomyces cacaoi]GEB47722.1 hypothetical protein SCA03_02730 [Streptomyces cacaoi]
MRFRLDIDMTDMTEEGQAAREIGRALRYWGGNLHHFALEPGDGSTITDSAHREIGNWRVVD